MKPRASDLFIVALNLVPLLGVWFFGWQTFDLVFLYWMENVIIGLFTVLRMVVRPYQHAIDAVSPLFLAPFFTVHYGMFCYVHGIFVVSLFGGEAGAADNLVQQVMLVMTQAGMGLAVLSLIALQVFDWLRDASSHGVGNDSVKALMTAPYRRIVVLHLVILGGGFAISSMGDPRIGLVLLIIIKTISDIYHDRRSVDAPSDEPLELTDEQLAEMHEQFAEPVVTVNGKEKRYASFAELKASKEFRMMKSVMRLMGMGHKFRIIDTFLDQKIAEESGSSRDRFSRSIR